MIETTVARTNVAADRAIALHNQLSDLHTEIDQLVSSLSYVLVPNDDLAKASGIQADENRVGPTASPLVSELEGIAYDISLARQRLEEVRSRLEV